MIKLWSGRRRRVNLARLLYSKDSKDRSHPAYKYAGHCSLVLYLAYGVCLYYYLYISNAGARSQEILSQAGTSDGVILRSLLATSEDSNVTEPAAAHGLPWETCEFEKSTSKVGWFIHHLWWIFVFFIGLAVVCDDFFVPSLEVISERLKLSEDVAGATFMAAGSSAPELFTSLIGVAQESDVGVGTIVGSAAFNILIIISLTGALAGQVLQLDWRPLTRDCIYYALSILAFLGVAYDGRVEWWEALILLIMYIIYIIIMIINPKLMTWMGKATCFQRKVNTSEMNVPDSEEQEEEETIPKHEIDPMGSFIGGHARRMSIIHHENHVHNGYGNMSLASVKDTDGHHHHHNNHNQSNSRKGSAASRTENPQLPNSIEEGTTPKANQNGDMTTPMNNNNVSNGYGATHKPAEDIEKADEERKEEEEESDDDDGIDVCCGCSCCPKIRSMPPQKPEGEDKTHWSMFMFVLKWFIYVVAFPFYFMCTFTIPDCSKKRLQKFYVATFLLSILWILALSFAMVTLVDRAGCTLNIDEFVMGLVIVAVGTSVPDCLSSIIVARRDGLGDMAVSNAIGSNIFDIDLGLGFPFLLRSIIFLGEPMQLLGPAEQSYLARGMYAVIPHVKFCIILFLMVALLYILFILSKFRLSKLISISFLIIYVLFVTYAFVQEFVCDSYLC